MSNAKLGKDAPNAQADEPPQDPWGPLRPMLQANSGKDLGALILERKP